MRPHTIVAQRLRANRTTYLEISVFHEVGYSVNVTFSVCLQAKEQAEEEAWQAEEARRAAIVAEERARLLRGAVHLRDYLPAEDARQITALMAASQ